MAPRAITNPKPAYQAEKAAWNDARLVRECMRGTEGAWSALVDKYRKLIFSIPIRYGFSADDAADIFQAVCLEMLSDLPKLREAKALPKWIIQVTAHKCFHHKRQLRRTESTASRDDHPEPGAPTRAEEMLGQAEEEQALREAISDLPTRCRSLIHMLFFEDPPRPYQELATELGLSKGSVGFIRQRCLEKLRKRLGEAGFS